MRSAQRDQASVEPLYPPDQLRKAIHTNTAYDDDDGNSVHPNAHYPRIRASIYSARVICQMERPPPDLTCKAICACLFSFWPVGIIAIIYAAKASSAVSVGDYESARTYNGYAKTAIVVSNLLTGIAIIIVIFVLKQYTHESDNQDV